MRKKRSEMTPEELYEERRKAKLRRIKQDRGIPANMLPEEVETVLSHTRMLYGAGMSSRQIAEAAGVHETTVQAMVRGTRSGPKTTGTLKTVNRITGERVLAVQLVPPAKHGAHMPAWPVVRRMQALIADGYSYNFLAEWMGVKGNASMWKLARGKVSYIRAATRDPVFAMYDKLSASRPESYGISPQSIGRSRATGKRLGWAPSGCWDVDTLDDPDAFPEWTGACGTIKGYFLHIKYKIPYCEPCRIARKEETS